MLSAYIPIAIFVVVATGFALFTLVFSSLLTGESVDGPRLLGIVIVLGGVALGVFTSRRR